MKQETHIINKTGQHCENWIRVSAIIVQCISYLCIVLFIYAAVSKLLEYGTFRKQLGQSPLLYPHASLLAWAVPITEIGIALLLCYPRTFKIGMTLFVLLMMVFIGYIIVILNFSEIIPCHCGGLIERLDWHEHLLLNFVFVALGVVSLILKRKEVTMVGR